MALVLKNISYKYKNQWQEEESYALKDVSLTLEKGEYTAIIGHTGSGKSTLLQHLNGLLQPSSGEYFFHGENVWKDGFPLKKLRQKVALCFQYPEYQLFEENILKDIAFGPKNLGLSEEESNAKAREAMRLVGLSQEMETLSPFALSGGQKRRVALAGILAMEPEYLILDEPTAGLDGAGKESLFSLLKKLNEERNITILLVSHNMDDVSAHAKRVLVMNKGNLMMDGSAKEIFSRADELKRIGLEIPKALNFYQELVKEGWPDIGKKEMPLTTEELAHVILKQLKEHKLPEEYR